MRNARGWRAAGIAAAWGLVMAACSSEAESTAPTVELSTTTVTTLPPTTVTTEAPAATVDPRIAEVEGAVAEYRRVFVDVLTDPDAPTEDLVAVAGGELLEALVDNILKERATGDSTSGEFLVEPRETSFEGENGASHLSCGLDGLAGFDSDGELLVPADEQPILRRYALVRSEEPGIWLVVGIVFDGSEKTSCDFGS